MYTLKGLNRVFNHPLNKNKPIKTALRAIWWKCNQLFFNYSVIIPFINGTKIVCYPDSSYGSLIVYTSLVEYEEMTFTNSFLKKGDVCIDVGAHLGDFSILAASKTGGKIFACEPTPQILDLLRENIALNSFSDRITIVEAAISDRIGKVSFSLTNETEVNHLMHNNTKNSKNSITVKSITLDQLAKMYKLTRINLLKVDVEGAEGLVFTGMKQLLSKGKIEAILFEVNPNLINFGSSFTSLFNLLHQHDFRVYRFNENNLLSRIDANWETNATENLVALHKTCRIIKKYTLL